MSVYIYGEEKPSLADLEHYGVKGMKWGVRRSQAELDRAAGRTRASRARETARKAGAGQSRGMGNRAAWNRRGSTKEIKSARAEVKKARNNIKKLERAASEATTKPAREAANKKLAKAKSDYELNHHRLLSVQMTNGEAAAVAALAFVVTPAGVLGASATGLGAAVLTQMRSQKEANIRSNLVNADLRNSMKTPVSEISRAATEFNLKEAKKNR